VFGNRVLRGICGPKGEEVTGGTSYCRALSDKTQGLAS
jgi:hypothetical protein